MSGRRRGWWPSREAGRTCRSLAEDLGRATGAGGYAASLRRARCGRFTVSEALAPEDLSPDRYAADGRSVLPVGEALDFLPAYRSGRAAGAAGRER